ncbi:MAG: glycosyltransferase, partial [Chloroflexota bacterium]
LYGVLNGIDVEQFNPATDPYIAENYDADTYQDARAENKRRLQASTGLQQRPDVPLIGMVSRLVGQKGIGLAAAAMNRLLAERDVQFVVLGTGDPELQWLMEELGRNYPDKARALIMYDAAVAQRIYAGVDMFLMPSHYEPCGIGQMLAMRYGALPIVRETGGLADTVENFDNAAADHGTGFMFDWEESEALLNTMRWALDTYRTKPKAWKRMQERAMNRDFSWERSARIYQELYESILA